MRTISGFTLAAFVVLTASTVDAQVVTPASQTRGVRNNHPSSPLTCTIGGASVTIAPGTTEWRAVASADATIACPGWAGTPFDRSRGNHVIACGAGPAGAFACGELGAISAAPPTVVVGNNGEFVVDCDFTAASTRISPHATVGPLLASQRPGTCRSGSFTATVALAAGTTNHGVSCASSKAGLRCSEVPVGTLAPPSAPAPPPPAPAPAPAGPPAQPVQITAVSPEVFDDSPYPIRCQAWLTSNTADSRYLAVNEGQSGKFALSDVKPDTLVVRCMRDTKHAPWSTVTFASPHKIPSVVRCKKTEGPYDIDCHGE